MQGENGLYAIALQLPHVFLPGSSPEENADVLHALIEALALVDRIYLRHRQAQRLPRLYDAGVRYARTEDWLPTPVLYWQRYGDCKSLAAARIAELREAGKFAKVAFRFKPGSNGTMYHILVQVSAGGFEDPSKVCGMSEDEWSTFGEQR